MMEQLNDLITLKNEEWYNGLVEDCRAMVVETGFRAKMEIIQGKWDIGERNSDDEHYKKFAHGSGEFINTLAEDIGLSKTDLYDCLKIYEMFNKLSDVLETFDKRVSWHKIRQKYLGKENEKKGTPRVCYHIEGIIQAFISWLRDGETDYNQEETDSIVEKFKKHLIKLRK